MIVFYVISNISIIFIFYKILVFFKNFNTKKTESHKRLKNPKINREYIENYKDSNEYNKTRYNRKLIPNDIDVIIIGSGISGLTTGGLLTRAGEKVLILEQHDIAGGTMHSFDLKGVEHETGLHYIGNIKKRQKILDLITEDKIEWCKLGEDNDEVYDEVFIEDRHYKFRKGVKNLIKYLVEIFPDEEEGIRKYFELVSKVAKRDLYFKLKCFPYEFMGSFIKYLDPLYYKYCKKNTYDTIKELVKDEELISVLCGQFGDYGITPKKSNFYSHASIVHHYLDGGYFPKGGTNVISNSMIKYIKKNGGEVLVGKKVDEVLVKNNVAYGVIMENGDIIEAEKVVSSIGVRNTVNYLIKDEKFKDEYKDILEKVDSSIFHMYCFLKLKGSPEELNLRSSNMWIYPDKDYDKCFEEYLNDPIEKPMPLFIAFSCKKDSEWTKKYENSSNCVVLTVVRKETFQEWNNSKILKRGGSYDLLKETFSERMINEGLLKFFPQLYGKILDVNVASPLTTKHYINSYYGESYGLDMTSHRLLKGHKLRPKTSINNFYLTGQDICTLGITGGMISGILTCNVITKYDNFMDIYLGNNIIKDLLYLQKKI